MALTREAGDNSGVCEKYDFVVYERLRGHKGQVLCVAAPGPKAGEALVATGAEDSTVRLWELLDVTQASQSASGSLLTVHSKSRVLLCICRCFEGEAITSVVFGRGGGDILYCSAGPKVFEFDLRAGRESGLLVTTPTAVFDDGSEEVNELTVHPKCEYFAAADDSGAVRIYNTRTRRLHKILRNAHTSICNTVRFRPRTSWELASGALDSTLVFWDFSSGRARGRVNLAEDGTSSATSASNSSQHQLFNPPFVHSVDFTSDGRYLAAGLGDGGVCVFDAKTRTPVERFDGHSAPVSQVHYPVFDSNVVVSAGNDQRLVLWDRRPLVQAAAEEATRKANSTVVGAIQVPDGRGVQSLTGHQSSNSNSKNVNASGGPRDAVVMEKSRNAKQYLGKKKKGRGTKAVGKFQSSRGGEETLMTHSGDTSQELPCNDAATREVSMQSTATVHDVNAAGKSIRSEDINRRMEDGGRVQAKQTMQEVGGVCHVKSSQPLFVVWLEDKPNWVSSTAVPYEALLVTDTSSEVKILRRRGSWER